MMSQAQLARAAGKVNSYISRLEDGGRDPSRETVGRLAEAMRLADGERALLFESAGFSAAGERFRNDPELVALAAILWDEELEHGHREKVRIVLRSIAEAWAPAPNPMIGGA